MSEKALDKLKSKIRSIIMAGIEDVGDGIREIDKEHGSFWSMFTREKDKRFPLFIDLYKSSFDKVAADLLKARAKTINKGILSLDEINQQIVAALWSYAEPPDPFMHRLLVLVDDDVLARRRAIVELMEDLQDRLNEILAPMGFRIAEKGGEQYVVNNVIAGSTIHGNVQQGAENTLTHNESNLNFTEISETLGIMEQEIVQLDASVEKYALLAEIEKMKGDLNGKQPSGSLLGKCAASIGTIMENVTAGVLTPGAASAIHRLLALF